MHSIIHNSSQPENIEKMCFNITCVSKRDAPELTPQATEIATKFHQAFSLFNKCHLIYDSKEFLDDEVIEEVGKILTDIL